jgi:hypothetical protein
MLVTFTNLTAGSVALSATDLDEAFHCVADVFTEIFELDMENGTDSLSETVIGIEDQIVKWEETAPGSWTFTIGTLWIGDVDCIALPE